MLEGMIWRRYFKCFVVVLAFSLLMPLAVKYTAFVTVAPASMSFTESVHKIDMLEKQIFAEERHAWLNDLQVLHHHAKADHEIVKRYLKVEFYLSLSVGLLAIIIGCVWRLFPFNYAVIFGGICTVVHGYASYWMFLTPVMVLVSCFVALALCLMAAFYSCQR
jgi:hypothetical protein